MSISDNIERFFETKYKSLLGSLPESEKALVSYCGQLTQEQVAKLESEVETRINEEGIPKNPLKKIFFISVETLQNMLIHGNKDADGIQHNFFILTKNGVKTFITSANLVLDKNITALENQIAKINSFEEPGELKQYYMQHLENNELSEKGGAGLGFITIAMKSGNKIKFGFEKIEGETSLFWFTSTISSE